LAERRRRSGVLLCIEGLDASGKTTQARRLVENLRRRGFPAVYTAEPSNGVVGRFIREHILRGEERVPSVVEAILFAIDRIDHMEREVEPLLRDGKVVVSDRCVFSSLAYQGAAGLSLEWIEEINRFTPRPDLAIYIDVPPKVVLERLSGKEAHASVMETLKTQREVRRVYLRLVKMGRLVFVDGNQPINEVSNRILEIVLQFLRENYRAPRRLAHG